MKQLSLKVETREAKGSRNSRRARREGKVPAVLYGKNEPRSLMIDAKTFSKLYKAVAEISAIIEIEDEKGVKVPTLIQDVQFNRLTDSVTHVDFFEVKADEEMHANIPVHAIGEAIGIKEDNAMVDIVLHEIEVYCLPKNLPESIEVDVTALRGGDSIFVKDLKAIDGVTYASDAEQPVIVCVMPDEEEAEPEATAAEGEASTEAEAKTEDKKEA